MTNRTVFLITVFVFCAIAHSSCSFGGKPEISVLNVSFIPSSMMIGAASSFMNIKNNGAGADKLVGCSIKELPSVRGELHDVIDRKMKKIDQIKIPSNDSVLLEKGGKHIMFFGLPDKIQSNLTLVLSFHDSGSLEIPVKLNQK